MTKKQKEKKKQIGLKKKKVLKVVYKKLKCESYMFETKGWPSTSESCMLKLLLQLNPTSLQLVVHTNIAVIEMTERPSVMYTKHSTSD